MKNCPYCGYPVEDNKRVCPVCGTIMKSGSSSSSSAKTDAGQKSSYKFDFDATANKKLVFNDKKDSIGYVDFDKKDDNVKYYNKFDQLASRNGKEADASKGAPMSPEELQNLASPK